MISPPCPFASLRIQPELIAHCLVDRDTTVTMRNALSLCCTSKVYHWVLNSNSFFGQLIKLIDPCHPIFCEGRNPSEKTVKALKISEISEASLKGKFLKLRAHFLWKSETFRGMPFGTAWFNGESFEMMSFENGTFTSQKIQDRTESERIEIPEEWRVSPRWNASTTPLIAASPDILAINHRCNSAVYLFTRHEKEFVTRYDVEGKISQLNIVGDLVCVVEELHGCRNLVIFNRKHSKKTHSLRLPLPEPVHETEGHHFPLPICFGKVHLVYTHGIAGKYHHYYLPISSLRTLPAYQMSVDWIDGGETDSSCFFFPVNCGFIKLSVNTDSTCDIAKIYVLPSTPVKRLIASGIVFPHLKTQAYFLGGFCLSNNRIITALNSRLEEKREFYSYDISSKETTHILSLPSAPTNFPFDPLFVSVSEGFMNVANRVYYCGMLLTQGCKEDSYIAQLTFTTLTYGKI